MLFKVICQYLFVKNQNNLVVKYSFYENVIFAIVKVDVSNIYSQISLLGIPVLGSNWWHKRRAKKLSEEYENTIA